MTSVTERASPENGQSPVSFLFEHGRTITERRSEEYVEEYKSQNRNESGVIETVVECVIPALWKTPDLKLAG